MRRQGWCRRYSVVRAGAARRRSPAPLKPRTSWLRVSLAALLLLLATASRAVGIELSQDNRPVEALVSEPQASPSDQRAPVGLREIWVDHCFLVVSLSFAAAMVLVPLLASVVAVRRLRDVNELNRDVGTALLADAGLGVDVVRNGEEALAMLPIDPQHVRETLLAWIKPRPPQPLRGLRPARVSDQPLPPALAAVPGLDVDTALERLLGKTAVYVGLLRRFVVSQAVADTRIAASIAGSEPDEAHRLLHTLKGLAATIGAASLRDVAARLEAAIETRQPALALETVRAETSLRLQALLAALTAALPPEDVLILPETVDTPVLLAACASLQEALEAGSFEAQAVLLHHQALFSQAFGPYMPPLRQRVGDFDFEGALVALREAMASRAGAGV